MLPKFRSKNRDFEFQAHPWTDRPLLVIGGMGRSGTTILRNCVAKHPAIACRNAESNYIHDLMQAAIGHEETPDRMPALPISADQYWQLHRQFILHMIWPAHQIRSVRDPQMISTYTMLNPRSALGLSKTFPGFRIFYIVRNGIEVVSSFQAFKAFEDLPFEHVCKIWAVRRDMLEYGADRDDFYLFRHEWLHDPERFQEKFTEALQACGLKFDEACLKPLARRFHPTTFPGESGDATRDLSRRADRWQYWTDEQRECFVANCQHLMDELGYPIPWLDRGG
ncbi:MAG: sulfotransferase [Pirellulaceae bacterium]